MFNISDDPWDLPSAQNGLLFKQERVGLLTFLYMYTNTVRCLERFDSLHYALYQVPTSLNPPDLIPFETSAPVFQYNFLFKVGSGDITSSNTSVTLLVAIALQPQKKRGGGGACRKEVISGRKMVTSCRKVGCQFGHKEVAAAALKILQRKWSFRGQWQLQWLQGRM